MTLSVFDLFKVGIGPSSSHTVGPMKAARMFAVGLRDDGLLPEVQTVRVCLYGSLGLTGKGHGSDKAVLLGLEGEQPATVDVDAIPARLAAIADSGGLSLLGEHEIGFDRRRAPGIQPPQEAQLPPQRRCASPPTTPTGRRSGSAPTTRSAAASSRTETEAEGGQARAVPVQDSSVLPYPFTTGAELLAHTARSGLPISGVMLENEQALGRTAAQI